jgi:hypothetical protein
LDGHGVILDGHGAVLDGHVEVLNQAVVLSLNIRLIWTLVLDEEHREQTCSHHTRDENRTLLILIPQSKVDQKQLARDKLAELTLQIN